MGRPPRHDADSLLDAAVALVAEGGPPAVTMTAVAARAGAASGSLYHRFPDRGALLAALWLRTSDRFQEGFVAAAEGAPGVEGAVAAARWAVGWARAHHGEARVLVYGASAYGHAEWSPAARERVAAGRARVDVAFAALARGAGLRGRTGVERVVFATVDVPLALMRRHLLAGDRVPRGAEDLVEPAIRALLTP